MLCSSTECQGPRPGGKTLNLMPHSRDVFSNLIRIASPSQSCHRTVPEACELIASTEIETDLGVILGPGAGVGRRKKVSWGRSGLPGAGKRARTSGLQRISWILSKPHGYEPVAQNGLGLGSTGLSNQRAPIFRVRLPRPRSCWAAAIIT